MFLVDGTTILTWLVESEASRTRPSAGRRRQRSWAVSSSLEDSGLISDPPTVRKSGVDSDAIRLVGSAGRAARHPFQEQHQLGVADSSVGVAEQEGAQHHRRNDGNQHQPDISATSRIVLVRILRLLVAHAVTLREKVARSCQARQILVLAKHEIALPVDRRRPRSFATGQPTVLSGIL